MMKIRLVTKRGFISGTTYYVVEWKPDYLSWFWRESGRFQTFQNAEEHKRALERANNVYP